MCLISQSAVSDQSRVACRDFLELWLPKKKKKKTKFVFLTDNITQNFLEGELKKKIRKEKPKVSSLTWVMVFLVA